MNLRIRLLCGFAALAGALGTAAAPASAEAPSPWWHLMSVSRPGNLSVGGESQEIAVTAINVGDGSVDPVAAPVVLTDVLPDHVTVTSVREGTVVDIASKNNLELEENPATKTRECAVGAEAGRATVTCTFDAGTLPPFSQVEVLIGVEVAEGALTGALNEASVAGGGAPRAQVARPITVSGSPTPFGVEDYEPLLEEAGGTPDTQAGSHPFQFTTTLNLNAALAEDPAIHEQVATPAALAKEVLVKLPPGLVGNPTAYPRCTLAQFGAFSGGGYNACPADTVLGVAVVTFQEDFIGSAGHGLVTQAVPIFNLEPDPGEPARFGFAPEDVATYLDTSVRTGEDYGVTVRVNNIPQLIGFLSNTVTFWGVPGSSSHDGARGLGCLRAAEGYAMARCVAQQESSPSPFLTTPTSCSGEPLQNTVEVASWSQPAKLISPQPGRSQQMASMDGCGLLPFHAQISAVPDVASASTPSGLTADVHVPQEGQLAAEGLAQANIKNITVPLPQGFILNPSSADGLQACSLAQAGYRGENPQTHTQEFTPDEASCPDASKIATVTIRTPLLPNPLHGFVYLAAPQNFAGLPQNPFSALVAMYLVARDPVSGTLVKLPGSVSLSPSGQITSTFADNPQLPFEDAEISFFGGERAPLATPARCGPYDTEATFEPWSNTAVNHEALHTGSQFAITSGPNGAPCPGASLPFTPSLVSETTDINAGGFTPLNTTISRQDGQQSMQSVVLRYPPGVAGTLTGVPLCPEAQANAGTCPESSLIGETIVSVGVGGDPFTVTGGKVYLTEHYEGAPFGLSIVNPAKAGPFDLQEGRPVVVRAKLEIDPITAALTVTAGPIPAIIEGFPLQIQHVNVLINRPNFTFNPTSCDPMSVTGMVGAAEGASFPVSTPLQVANCANLKFEPAIHVSTTARASKANGASLAFKIAYPRGAMGRQAWFNEAKFTIPKQLPARLTTIQKACLAATYETNRGACPAASKIGTAIVHTQLLPVPLEGPVYFVSYGAAKFPDAVLDLHGYGVHIELHGETFISKGVTSATFRNTPDLPFESIEVTVPSGPFSEFGANLPHGSYDFCARKLVMPTFFKASNGLEVHKSTRIAVRGCSTKLSVSSRSVKHRTLTLRVYVPAVGKLKAQGAGLTAASKTARGLEELKLVMHAKRAGSFKTKVRLTFTPTRGRRRRQVKSLSARFK